MFYQEISINPKDFSPDFDNIDSKHLFMSRSRNLHLTICHATWRMPDFQALRVFRQFFLLHIHVMKWNYYFCVVFFSSFTFHRYQNYTTNANFFCWIIFAHSVCVVYPEIVQIMREELCLPGGCGCHWWYCISNSCTQLVKYSFHQHTRGTTLSHQWHSICAVRLLMGYVF